MTPKRLSELLGALDNEGTSPGRRRSIEAELAADPTGRSLLAAREAFSEPADDAPRVDVIPGVLGSLPTLSARERQALAGIIEAGWTDPALRAELWRGPRVVLAQRGVVLPERVEVVAASLAEAHLPRADRIVLPLPPAQARAYSTAEARRCLAASDIGWLWGPPWAQAEVPVLGERAPWRQLFLRLAPALAGVAAVVGVLLWLRAGTVPAGDLSGAAGMAGERAPGLPAPVAVTAGQWPAWTLGLAAAVVALALFAAWLWWRRR